MQLCPAFERLQVLLLQLKDSERKPNPSAGPNMSLNAREDVLEQSVMQNAEWDYARNVEVCRLASQSLRHLWMGAMVCPQ